MNYPELMNEVGLIRDNVEDLLVLWPNSWELKSAMRSIRRTESYTESALLAKAAQNIGTESYALECAHSALECANGCLEAWAIINL